MERESGIQLVYKVGSMNLARKGTQWESFLEEHATAMSKENIPYALFVDCYHLILLVTLGL